MEILCLPPRVIAWRCSVLATRNEAQDVISEKQSFTVYGLGWKTESYKIRMVKHSVTGEASLCVGNVLGWLGIVY